MAIFSDTFSNAFALFTSSDAAIVTKKRTPKAKKLNKAFSLSQLLGAMRGKKFNAKQTIQIDTIFAFVIGAALASIGWGVMHAFYNDMAQHHKALPIIAAIGGFFLSSVKIYFYVLNVSNFDNDKLDKIVAIGTVLLIDTVSAFAGNKWSIGAAIIQAVLNGMAQASVISKNAKD